MSGFNSERNGAYQKKKWEIVITVISLTLCVIGLAAFSVISYFQTMYAFLPLNDPSIPVLGQYIAVGLAFIFQYGQNAALYYKNHYTSGKHVFSFLFWNVTDKTICTFVFALCAVIDAGTNVIWLEENRNISMMKWYFQVLVYASMIAVVFVEEVLGNVLQSAAHAYTELQKIMAFEQNKGSHKQERHEEPTQPRAFNPEVMEQMKKAQGAYKMADQRWQGNREQQKHQNNRERQG